MAEIGTQWNGTSRSLDAEIGRRLAKTRLGRNITQKALAEEAGIGLRTLRRLESGQSSTLDSFLRTVIALGLAEDLLSALPSQEIRPIERMDLQRAERKRARPAAAKTPSEPWSWGEEPRD